MPQLVLAEELVKMGIIWFNLDNFLLDGVSYSRSASFSQRVQIAAERMCEEYQKQGITCLLVKDGMMLTLWLSQPFKVVRDALQTPPLSPDLQPQEYPQIQPQEDLTEKTMIYRGNVYKVTINTNSSPDNILPNKITGQNKKRVYRGLDY
jgi:hypothetical protein